jgi:hypothetical protein
MAKLIRFFMSPDDEVAFLRFLERFTLEVYPVRVPPDWRPFKPAVDNLSQMPLEVYLAATDLGPVQVDRVKRGKDKGAWRIDEVRSPVIYWERSQRNEEGELLSGKFWAELDVTPQTGRRDAAPDRFRKLVVELEEWLKKSCRRSEPVGFWVGPSAARQHKEGLVLRDSEPRGGVVRPFR